MHKPFCKTLLNRFKQLVGLHREEVNRTGRKNGVVERFGEKEVFRGDIKEDMADKREMSRAEKSE